LVKYLFCRESADIFRLLQQYISIHHFRFGFGVSQISTRAIACGIALVALLGLIKSPGSPDKKTQLALSNTQM
jgi:hypothetical protein